MEPPRYLISPQVTGWYLAWGADDGIDSEFHGGDDPEATKAMMVRELRDLAAGRPDHPEQVRPDLNRSVTVIRAQVIGSDQCGIGQGLIDNETLRSMPLRELLQLAIDDLNG